MTYGKFNVDWQQRVDFDKLRKDRVTRANQMLHKYGIGAAIVFNWDSRRYLSSVWNHPYSRGIPKDYCLFIRDAGFPYVTVNHHLDDEQVRGDATWMKDRIVDREILEQPYVIMLRTWDDAAKRWAHVVGQIKALMKKHGVDGLPVSVDYCHPIFIQELQKGGLTVLDGNAWILEADMIKTEDEVELMKMAASCQEAGYGVFIREFRPGMTENDVRSFMAKGIYAAGAEYIEGWVTNSGIRAAPRNFNLSDRTVRPGELISIEACHVTYCGYKCCYDRTFLIGSKPTPVQQELYNVTAELHHKIMDILKPGLSTRTLAKTRPFPPKTLKTLEDIKAVRETWYTNHLGGMGVRWDGGPNYLPSEPEIILEKNMCLAYHSIHCVKGSDGVSIENTYRITDAGCECLTKWPIDELMVVGL